jgi:hypothetical protein
MMVDQGLYAGGIDGLSDAIGDLRAHHASDKHSARQGKETQNLRRITRHHRLAPL